MELVKVVQGSPEWDALRAKYFTGSEAPVMMAASKNMKRQELLDAKANYSEKEYSEWMVKNLFEKGHEIEEQARAFLEEEIGEQLFPVTGIHDEGKYAASYDGLTMFEDVGFECKTRNERLDAAMEAGEVPEEYTWQLEHQFLVCENLECIYFTVSDGTREGTRWVVYKSQPARREKLVRGWDQFEEDLAEHKPREVKGEVVGRATPAALPMLDIKVEGKVLASNLDVFRTRAYDYIEKINTNLVTDQDFANAEKDIKFCDETEKRLDLSIEQVIGQIVPVDEIKKALEEIREAVRAKRLTMKKLVDAEKQNRRRQIVEDGEKALQEAINKANEEFAPLTVSRPESDFWAAIKGKRSFQNMEDAVKDALAHAKIALTEQCDHIRKSLEIIYEQDQYHFLFNDAQEIVHFDHDHLRMLVKDRIQTRKEAEDKRIDEAVQERTEKALQESPQPTKGNVTPLKRGEKKPERPEDWRIVNAVAGSFAVDYDTALAWLREIDFDNNALAKAGGK